MCRIPRAIVFRFNSKTQWQMFLLLYGRHVCAPSKAQTWRLHTNLYKFRWNTSSNNARMKTSRGLILSVVVYIAVIYHISDSWLDLLMATIFSFDHMPAWVKTENCLRLVPNDIYNVMEKSSSFFWEFVKPLFLLLIRVIPQVAQGCEWASLVLKEILQRSDRHMYNFFLPLPLPLPLPFFLFLFLFSLRSKSSRTKSFFVRVDSWSRRPRINWSESKNLAGHTHTAVKRLSMREKLREDRIVQFEKPCMWRTTTASSCELNRNIYSFTSMKFIGDDREEEEELMTRIVLE